MQKTVKAIGVALCALVSFLLLLSGVAGTLTSPAQAQDQAPASQLFLPVAAVSNSGQGTTATPTASPTASPTATPTATPTQTPSVLRPSLNRQYAISVTKNIVYAEAQVTLSNTVTTTQLLLDFYEPANAPAGKRPVIMIIHGGAFFRGSRQSKELVRAAEEYAGRGYAVAAISYRLGAGPTFGTTFKIGPQPVVSSRVAAYHQLVNQVDSIHFLNEFLKTPDIFALLNPISRLGQAAAMDDTLSAMDWLASQAASRSLDLSRLVLFGGSAGSINSLHAAYALDDLGIPVRPIAAVIDHWGSLNLDDTDVLTDGTAFMEAGEPPLFIAHGTADISVPITFSQAVFDRANALGIPVEFNIIPSGGHGFDQIELI
jgi:acetyl esterase/lipase